MGGNEIVLLYGDQIEAGEEIPTSLRALDPPNVGGQQAGLLYKSPNEGAIKVKIVDVTARDYISMCGGLTQVLGKALIETDLAKDLDIELQELTTRVTLETDVGIIPLEIKESGGETTKVLTGMKSFVEECYQLGIEPVTLAGVDALKVGKFIVVRTDDVKRVYPDARFSKMDQMTKEILKDIQEDFDNRGYIKRKNVDFALYDLKPANPGNNARIIFPHRISTGHIEPACGTGTVACGIAMAEKEEIDPDQPQPKLLFESGGDTHSIGGPDLTHLRLIIDRGKVTNAYFSHSLVEVLATGELRI